MTVIALCSVKHSPGATTLALALVTAWTDSGGSDGTAPVLVEADAAGGDLAARLGLGFDPGLVSMAAEARHAGSGLDLASNAQGLPCNGFGILGPTSPEQAGAAVRTLAPRLADEVRAFGGGVIDCGRWSAGSLASEVMRLADLTLVVVRPDLAGVQHLRERLDSLSSVADRRLGIVLVGERPYGIDSVRHATGLPLVTTVAVDSDGAEAIHGGATVRSARKSSLVRSARSILDLVASRNVEGVPA